MTRPQLNVALCDDDPPALVLMDGLLKATLRLLDIDQAMVATSKIADHNDAEDIAASGTLDLLITDLMWPVVGQEEWRQGLTIAEVAKTANPRTVVVVITSKTEQEQHFRDEARQRGADLAMTWDEAFGAGKTTTARDLAKRLRVSTASAVPQVVDVERTTIGLVGLDTVAFSEQDDDIQQAVVRSFLGYMDEAWTSAAKARVRPVFVFTGDGVFLGMAGDEGPRLALDVAVFAWDRFTQLAGYRTRLAVHSGPANIVTLSTGTQQLVGHAVNWLFRAVDAAADNGLVITSEYYAAVLAGGRDVPRGLVLTQRTITAKHDRPLVVYDVNR